MDSLCARSDIEFDEDVRQVPCDGLDRQIEVRGNLRIAATIRHEPQHLDLPFSEPVRSFHDAQLFCSSPHIHDCPLRFECILGERQFDHGPIAVLQLLERTCKKDTRTRRFIPRIKLKPLMEG